MEDSKQITDLWAEVGNKCLSKATALIDSETVPTAATVETVKGLVETAISIDLLNLRWAEQSRYGAAACRSRAFPMREAGS